MKSRLFNFLRREEAVNSTTDPREESVINAADVPIDDEDGGWFLVAPYGVYNGSKPGRQQHFGRPQAEAMVSEFNSFRGRLGRLFKGRSIFNGHPDVDPARWPDDRRIGKIMDLQVTDKGLRALAEWNSLGLENKQEGFRIFPSPRWDAPAGRDRFEPDRLISIGLTNNPRIENSEPVFNSNDPEPTTTTDMDRQALTKKLNLPAEATDEEILAKLDTLISAADTAATKETELADATTKLTEVTTEKEQAENSLTEANATITTLREAQTNSVLDSAITRGVITKAERPAWAEKLSGDKREETINSLTAAKGRLASTALDLSKTREEVVNVTKTREERREAISNAVDTIQRERPALSREEARFKAKTDDRFKALFVTADAE